MTTDALDRFLDLGEQRSRRAPAEPGIVLCHALSDALDAAVRSLLPPDSGNVAVLAAGGYGRRELCLRSDVDLLILYDGEPPSALVDAVLYPLWDAGLKVGHAVRTVREAMAAAAERTDTLTAALTTRLLAGPREMRERLQDGLTKLLQREVQTLREALHRSQALREEAEPFQLQEADLKSGRGGLRALDSLVWLKRAEALAAGEPGRSAALATVLTDALNSLLATRNALHAVTGRPQDVWLLDLQPPACEWLDADRDAWSQQLYLAMRAIDHHVRVSLGEPPSTVPRHATSRPRRAWLSAFRASDPMSGRAGEPESDRGYGSAGVPTRRPALQSVLDRAGRLASNVRRPAEFAADEAMAIAAAHGPTWSEADRRGLLALLRAGERGRRIFDDLDRLGWLERAMPEWRHVRGLPQHVPFHRHPVDVHLWRTVIEVLNVAEGRTDEPWARQVADDLGSLDDLLLAALLHDIGKGWPGEHSQTGAAAAAAFCRRTRFEPESALTVSAAVRHHLLLPTVATRRDIADPRVVEDIAARAGRVRTLQVLYLLSAADSLATGPGMWTPWKASLVRSLFTSALAVLEGRSTASPLLPGTGSELAQLLERAAGRVPEALLRRHLAAMVPGYLRSFSPDDVLRHVRLMEPPPQERTVRLDARSDDTYGDLALAMRDRPGLIALTSGVLALHNLSVLDARFFTRGDGVALQVFSVVDALSRPIEEERWRLMERDVERALAGELPLEQRLAEKRHAYRRVGPHTGAAEVRVVPEASDEFTVVEVHAADRVGLLHDITTALFTLNMDVHLAKIDTQGRSVVDTFYLRDLAGRPLRDAEQLGALRGALLKAVEG